MHFCAVWRRGLLCLTLFSWVALGGLSPSAQGVRINEFLASNGRGLATHEEEREDWVELYNQSGETIDLSGWYLTDSMSELTRWQFPSGTTLGAGEYLIIFCNSWDGEPLVEEEYFANFSLDREGEYLALIGPDGQSVIHEFFPAYPPQYTDISYSDTGYHLEPTPGAANSVAYAGPPALVTFSEAAGYRDEPFLVELSCASPEARIHYTLDGSTPSAESRLYEEPLRVEKITCLRAVAIEEGRIPSPVSTRTWLFAEEVLAQSQTPPPGWPVSRQFNNQKFEYGMNAKVVKDPRWAAGIREGIRSIDTLSLVTDLTNLFDPESGIYVNAKKGGEEWECPVSVECISPQDGGKFQIDAGLRIRGSSSRSPEVAKHSLRLFFRSRYGGSLQFPLFEDEGADEFQRVDLRTSQTWSWSGGGYPYDTFIRETFSRDTQRDMQMPYTRSRFYHLYINGQYWGLYQTQERSDVHYAESYLGGAREDWDYIKTTYPGYVTTAVNGTLEGFQDYWAHAISQGVAGNFSTNYYWLKGVNPDGSPIPDSPRYLDEDNLIAYMLITYFTRDPETPYCVWEQFPNNLVALYNRENPDGFKWLRHDCEHSLGANRLYPVTTDLTQYGGGINNFSRFNPMRLHQRLMEHPDYRMRWADAVQRQILNPGGALSIEKSLERWNRRQAELDSAIIVESARWGHGHTRETWLAECDYVKEEFIAKSAEYLIPQLRKRGWFPLREAPLLEQGETTESGSVQVKFRGQGPIYYMLDNSDPRLPGGAPHTGAWILQPGDDGSELQEWLVEVPKDSRLKVRSWDAVEEDWSPLAELDTTVYGVPCDLKITELMYAPKVSTEAAMAGWSRDDLAWLELMNSGDNVLELDGFRFAEGITYTFPPFRLLAGERLVLAKNLEAFSTVYDLDGLQLLCGYSGNLARKGERLLLLSPEGETLLDFSYSNLWYPESDQGGYALVVVDTAAEQALWSTPENWKRGASPGGSPGTADEDEEFWPAQIVTQPLSQELIEGEPLTLCVAAVGVAPRLYQWFKDGASIPGATRSRFLLEAAEVSDSGSYGVWVSNAHGSALSQQVSIKVRSVPRVSYHYEGGSVLLRFTGTLYESRDLKDWQKVEGADGQLILDPSLGTRYYRSASEE